MIERGGVFRSARRGWGQHVGAAGGLLVLAAHLVLFAGIMQSVRSSVTSGNLERNSVVGIRTKVTKSSDAAWQAGHEAAVPWLRVASLAGYLAGLLTVVTAVAQLMTGAVGAAGMAVPATGFVISVALVLVATRKANEAGRDSAGE